MQVITAEWLKAKDRHNCSDFRKLFPSQFAKWKKLFPNGMKLTLKNIQICADNSLAIEWFGLSAGLLSMKAMVLYGEKTRVECYKGFDVDGSRFYYNNRSKAWREYLQHCVRPLWEAIKLDRKSK